MVFKLNFYHYIIIFFFSFLFSPPPTYPLPFFLLLPHHTYIPPYLHFIFYSDLIVRPPPQTQLRPRHPPPRRQALRWWPDLTILLPLLHVLRHSHPRNPPLRREAILRQPLSQTLRNQVGLRDLGLQFDRHRVDSVFGGEKQFDSGHATLAHHSRDIKKSQWLVVIMKHIVLCKPFGFERVRKNEIRSWVRPEKARSCLGSRRLRCCFTVTSELSRVREREVSGGEREKTGRKSSGSSTVINWDPHKSSPYLNLA